MSQDRKPAAGGDANEFVRLGRDVVRAEGEALAKLADGLGETFARAVQMILDLAPQGRLVVSGIGKAGFIGMKTSSTFASTGVPSFFLHPAEAPHGDFGRYTRHDVVLLFTNSGASEEIVRMLPHIREIGCQIICVTGKPESEAAKYSDVVLSIGSCTEAGPLGLAPTTSTTLMLALADALAMAVLSKQQFSREKFALYHPGGTLGRRLMTVDKLMRRGDQHVVLKEPTLTKDVIHAISRAPGRPGAATIVDWQGVLSGIFTDGDLRRCLEQNLQFLDRPVSQFMGRTPKTITPEKLAEDAIQVMRKHKIDQLLVINADRVPVGMLDIQDLLDL